MSTRRARRLAPPGREPVVVVQCGGGQDGPRRRAPGERLGSATIQEQLEIRRQLVAGRKTDPPAGGEQQRRGLAAERLGGGTRDGPERLGM